MPEATLVLKRQHSDKWLAGTQRTIWAALPLLQRLLSLTAVVALGGVAAEPLAATERPRGPEPMGIVSRIERHPVESRALAAVGYSHRLRALEVEFKRGGTYRYLDVPRSVYRALLTAESKAGFYNQNVRGKYRSVYVRPRRKR